MKVEKLQLADTPAELWRRIGGQLRDAMREIIDPGEKWLLGGGTVLEARWKHRYTKDIDLKLRPPTGRDRYLLARQLPHFVTRMQELGAERIIDAERQLIVSFGKAVLDIFQNAPTPGSGEEEYLIDEQPETVLSNAQILYGKLGGRGMRSPVRDIYDIAVAEKADRGSLAIAVNCLRRGEAEDIADDWETATAFHKEFGKRLIHGVPEKYTAFRDDPAGHGSEAVLNTRYRTAELRCTNGRLSWNAMCEDGNRQQFSLDGQNAAALRQAITRVGLREYIGKNTLSDFEQVLALGAAAQDAGQPGTRIVWSTAAQDLPKRPSEEARGGETSDRQRRNTEYGH